MMRKITLRAIAVVWVMLFLLSTVLGVAFATEPSNEPQETPPTAADDLLTIDTSNAYSDMDRSYGNGYVPKVSGGRVVIILPLLGNTQNNEILVTPDIGTTGTEPFVYANYQFKVNKNDGVYLVRLELPLTTNRMNGLYPVIFNVEYKGNKTGQACMQSFTVQVSITDGIDPNLAESITAPDLFLTNYKTEPETVMGGDEFTISITLKNVGNQAAKNIKLSYSDSGAGLETATGGINPSNGTGLLFIDSIGAGGTYTATLTMKASNSMYAGQHKIPLTMEYGDGKGGVYSSMASLTVTINQPVTVQYDQIFFPEMIESGESVVIPLSLYNIGSAPVYKVFWTLESSSLISASVYLGNIEPGMTGMGEMKVFAATVSADNPYGSAGGILTLSYEDADGNPYTQSTSIKTEILAPADETIADEDTDLLSDTTKQSQWWISILVAVCIIAVITSVIIILRFNRVLKLKE